MGSQSGQFDSCLQLNVCGAVETDAIGGLILWPGVRCPLDGSSTNLSEVRVAFQRQPTNWHGIVEGLGEEFSCPFPEVERMLSAVVHQLEQRAQIKEFISALAVTEGKGVLRG